MVADSKLLQIAQTYWEQSGEDFKLSKSSLKKKDYQMSGVLAVQAGINALTSICLANRRSQNPSYSLTELARVCEEYDESFITVREICLDMDEIQERSPFEQSPKTGTQVDENFANSLAQQAREIRRTCYKVIRKRNYFAVPRFFSGV